MLKNDTVIKQGVLEVIHNSYNRVISVNPLWCWTGVRALKDTLI